MFAGLRYFIEGPFLRFTDASAAMLLDTGNYDIDWRYLQPILWLNSESIDGSNFSELALSSYINYPSEYTATFDGVKAHTMGFDFKYEAKSYYQYKIDCDEGAVNYGIGDMEKKYFCSAESFYDPDNDGYTGLNPQQDYTPTKYPRKMCRPGYATFPGNSGCLKYELKQSAISIIIDGDSSGQ